MKRILVIIPAYNEQESILKTVRTLQSCQFSPEYTVDYIVVNDGSRDNTLSVLRENGLRHLKLPMNLGIGGAMQTGYMFAAENGYDYAVQLDGDGQHNPEYIERIVAPLERGEADMVVGSRFIEKQGFQSTGLRQLGIRIVSATIHLLTRKRVLDVTSGFRACNRDTIVYFSKHYAEDYPEPEAIITALKNDFRVAEVPVIMNERSGGKSSIYGLKSVYYMLKVEFALFIQAMRRKGD